MHVLSHTKTAPSLSYFWQFKNQVWAAQDEKNDVGLCEQEEAQALQTHRSQPNPCCNSFLCCPQDQPSAGLSPGQAPPFCGSFLLSCGESLHNTCATRFAFKAIRMQISTFPVISKRQTGQPFDFSRDKMLLFLQQGANVCKISSFWNL